MERILSQLSALSGGAGTSSGTGLAHQLGGRSMDLAALDVKQGMRHHEVEVGLALGLLNHQKRNLDRVIESLGR